MYRLVAGELPPGVERRRALCHLRQIAMYVSHVVLRFSFTEIGVAYGRDRTTVGHACKVIEDRRDDRAYDDFVSSIERCAVALFEPLGGRPNAG
jgi:chromosomal replication initiation ATPase DnaA